jgi:hypothetical protein
MTSPSTELMTSGSVVGLQEWLYLRSLTFEVTCTRQRDALARQGIMSIARTAGQVWHAVARQVHRRVRLHWARHENVPSPSMRGGWAHAHTCAVAGDYQQQGSKPPQQAAPATQQAAANVPVDQLSAATAATDFRSKDFM